MKVFLQRLAYASGVLILTLGLWQVAAWRVADPKLVPPLDMLWDTTLPSMARFAEKPVGSKFTGAAVIFHHIVITARRCLIGTTLGVAAGVGFALASTLSSGISGVTRTVLTLLKGLPLLALVPLFLVWFGSSEAGVVVFIAFGCFVVVGSQSLAALSRVPPAYLAIARTYGEGTFARCYRIYLPAILPELLGGVKFITAMAWVLSLGGEYLAAPSGLGFLVVQSYTFIDMPKVSLLLLVYVVLGLGVTVIVHPMVMFLLRWKRITTLNPT